MDIAFYGGLSIASLYGFLNVNNSLTEDRKKLNRFYKAKSFTPYSLLEHLTSGDIGTLKKNPENPTEYITTSFVEGLVDCTHPVTSILNKKSKLVYSYSYIDDLYSNDSIMSEERLRPFQKVKPTISEPPEFEIVDPERPNYRCIFHRSLDVDATNGTEQIAVERTFRRLSFTEKILIFLGSFAEFVAQLTTTAWAYRGIKIGVIENELGIRVGGPLTVFGDVIYNMRNNTIRMDKPLYLLKDKTFVINKLKDAISGKRVEKVLLFATFAVTTGILVSRLWKRYSEYKKRKQREKEREIGMIEGGVHELQEMEKGKEVEMKEGRERKGRNLPEELRCVICNEAQRTIAADPCHHLSMCKSCFKEMPEKICPICKEPVREVAEVYVK